MPGDLVFRTNGGGTQTTDRVAIGSNGALKILAGCPGIDFSAIQTNNAGMTSETLDSYEEGTWTPSLTFGGANVGLTYSNGPVGQYTKIGKVVIATFGLRLLNKGTSTGTIQLEGFPFSAHQGAYFHSGVAFTLLDAPTTIANSPRQGFMSGTTMQFRFGQDNNTVPTESVVDNDTSMFGTAIYLIS